MFNSTPKLLGEQYLDGFLWGKANFPVAKKTTRGYINITYQPTDIIIDIMERLERYANIEINESTSNQNNRISEIIDIYFYSAISSPKALKLRELRSYWDEEFLKGVIYSRMNIMQNSNQLYISKETWVDIICEICENLKIPYSKYDNRLLIPREGYKHEFFKEWINAYKNDKQKDIDLIESEDFQSLLISKETGYAKNHNQIRLGFNGNEKDLIRSIRGVFEGRLFWFRREILLLITHLDEEIKYESRLALLHIGTDNDILQLSELENQEKNKIGTHELKYNESNSVLKSMKSKRIYNTKKTYEDLLDRTKYNYNISHYDELVNSFYNWLLIKEDTAKLEQQDDTKYIQLYNDFIDKDSNEINFIISRIREMKNNEQLNDYHYLYNKILMYDSKTEIDEKNKTEGFF